MTQENRGGDLGFHDQTASATSTARTSTHDLFQAVVQMHRLPRPPPFNVASHCGSQLAVSSVRQGML